MEANSIISKLHISIYDLAISPITWTLHLGIGRVRAQVLILIQLERVMAADSIISWLRIPIYDLAMLLYHLFTELYTLE